MKIIGIILLIAGIGVGFTDKEYGAMVFGILLGAFLIWYSPKYKANAEIRKKEKQEKRFKKMVENMSDDEFAEFSQTLNSIDNTSSGIGKVGYRTPSLSKSISASTTGKLKRQVKSAVDPTYNVKGVGYIKNPKRAIKNKLYKKKTKSLF